MPEPRPAAGGGEAAMRRRLILLGCALLVPAFAVQLAVNLLWPAADFGALLLVLYLAVKWAGDRLAAGMVPDLIRFRALDEWLDWLRVALPMILGQAALLVLRVGAARSAAAAFPCALYVIAMGWLRGGMTDGGGPDSLGQRLAAWP
jgi:hypothetical protein